MVSMLEYVDRRLEPNQRHPFYSEKVASIRGVASFEVDNLVLFDYLGESEIWSDKSGDLWGEVPYNR
jgi:hypothetical protein